MQDEEEFEKPYDDSHEECSSDDIPDLGGLEGFLTSEIENRQPRQLEEKEVQVIGVYEHHEEGMPSGYSAPAFVLLRDKAGRQVLIWVGRAEAYAISTVLENLAFDRPMTHDLLRNVLEKMGGKVERILIDDLWQDTYYAKITVQRNGETLQIDSRPSDAIALALRVKSPIFMAENVLQSASVEDDVDTGEAG